MGVWGVVINLKSTNLNIFYDKNPLHQEFRDKLDFANNQNKANIANFNTQLKLNEVKINNPCLFSPNSVSQVLNSYRLLLEIKLHTDSLTALFYTYECLEVKSDSKLELLLHINNLIRSKQYQYYDTPYTPHTPIHPYTHTPIHPGCMGVWVYGCKRCVGCIY